MPLQLSVITAVTVRENLKCSIEKRMENALKAFKRYYDTRVGVAEEF